MFVTTAAAPRPGPRPGKSREEIVQCTISMLDREGPDALTFRAVARELGISVGALSRYFKNLADLEDEVVAQIMSALRPLDASSKLSLRDQLVRLGMDLLEIHSAHPYLLQINGPASAAVNARHTRQSMEALLAAGFEFERALALFSMVGNLPYAWGVQHARQSNPELQARVAQVFAEQMGALYPRVEKMILGDAPTAIYRRWLQLYIDGMLPTPNGTSKRR